MKPDPPQCWWRGGWVWPHYLEFAGLCLSFGRTPSACLFDTWKDRESTRRAFKGRSTEENLGYNRAEFLLDEIQAT